MRARGKFFFCEFFKMLSKNLVKRKYFTQYNTSKCKILYIVLKCII